MKKILFILILFAAFAFNFQNAYAEENLNGKIIVESLGDVVLLDTENVELKVLEGVTLDENVTFETNSVIEAKIKKIIDPKRGKRNGYLVIEPISYTIPSEEKTVETEGWRAKIVDYKPFDVKNAAMSAGLTVAGLFVKGISQAYYFGKGVINAEDGENRLKSGVKNVYQNSPLAYIEEGKPVNISKGDVLLLKFCDEGVLKWKTGREY